ncbi:MAG: hypothetical protein RIS79_1683 [Verrucomicrobiota bacterium]|jgi:hypothetical protein
MSSQPSSPRAALRLAFYFAAVALALIHVFVTFRGLSSVEGMQQAQLARQVARTFSWQTKVIQPYAWAQMEKAGKSPSPLAMAETTQPPLQPLVLAAVFRIFQPLGEYAPYKGSNPIYFFDRLIAAFGVVCWLLTMFFTHGAARRLFNEKVAAITAISLLVCMPGWEMATSGSSRALLSMLFALAFRLLASAFIRSSEGQPVSSMAIGIGLVCAAMVLTHWLAAWLVLGLVVSVAVFLPGGRLGAVLVAVPPLIALTAWGCWQMQLCGDPLGATKALFQAQLASVNVDSVQRDLSPGLTSLVLDDLLRRLGLSWQEQLSSLYGYLGYGAVASFFFPSLLHPFRHAETAGVRWSLAVVFISLLSGMGFVGLPDKLADDNALYLVITPALSLFGAAMLVVMWSRLHSGHTFWAQWGGPAVALAITALPMLVNLPVYLKFGLTLGSRMQPHWPPYVPERAAVLRELLEPDEYLLSDAPAFVAWYGDVPCAALPAQREDFSGFQKTAAERKARLAGFVMTPVSARCDRFSDIFTGPYAEWRDLIIRGPMLAFEKDFNPSPDFPFKIIHPLIVVPVGSKENLSIPMVFYSNRNRVPAPAEAKKEE